MVNDLAMLFAAGLVAGGMNALAGGGSFVSFPALVLAGLPSVAANASSTVALVPAAITSAWAYTTGRDRIALRGVGGLPLAAILAISLAGGLLGAILLLVTPVALFDGVIPWLLLLAALTFALGRKAGARLRGRVHLGTGTLVVIQFVLGVYGGYFGGAVGVMMLAAWSLLDGADLKQLNPTRTVVVAATNAVAVICFVIAREVWWPQTIAMLFGGLAGGYLGARLGQRLPAHMVRGLIIALTVVMTAIFFRRAYF